MELKTLYNQIENPIEDLNVIQELVSMYSHSIDDPLGFYTSLVKFRKGNNLGYDETGADKFVSSIFNKWKKNVLSMTKEEFAQLYLSGAVGEDFIKLRNTLKHVPDASTDLETRALYRYACQNDRELRRTLEKYSWDALRGNSPWIHVCSRYISAKRDPYPEIEHRLYLNVSSLDVFKVALKIVEKCESANLIYYFKFDPGATRDDSIVIYSSTEKLSRYIEIVRAIVEEIPGLTSRIKEPPILTGKIDGWIGYGTEPLPDPNGERNSFNGVRASIIEKAIEKEAAKWVMNHRNNLVMYKNKKMRIYDYFIEKCFEHFKRFGVLTLSGVLDKYRKDIFGALKAVTDDLLLDFYNGNQDLDTYYLRLTADDKLDFDSSMIKHAIKKVLANLLNEDSDFLLSVQSTIKCFARQNGVDAERFCFDIRVAEKINEGDIDFYFQDIQQVVNQIENKGIEAPKKLTFRKEQNN